MLHQTAVEINLKKETALSLNQKIIRCAELTFAFMLEYFVENDKTFTPLLKNFELNTRIQDLAQAEYHWLRFPFGGLIQEDWDDDRVDRFVRAMYCPPHEGALWRDPITKKVVEISALAEYHTDVRNFYLDVIYYPLHIFFGGYKILVSGLKMCCSRALCFGWSVGLL